MKTRWVDLFFGLALTLASLSTSAFAFIPPSQYLIQGMTAKKSGLKTIKVQSIVTKLDAAGKTTDVHFKEASFYDANSRLIRSVVTDDSGVILYRQEKVLQSPGTQPTAGEKIDSLLLAMHSEGLTGILQGMSIPIRGETELASLKNEDERRKAETTALKRWKKTYAWVIGRAPTDNPDRVVSQLWIEKDSFLPLRLVSATDLGRVEWNFDNYRYSREVPFPRQTTFFQEDRPKIQSLVSDTVVNSGFPELRGAFEKGYTEAGNQADASVRELISSYFEWIR